MSETEITYLPRRGEPGQVVQFGGMGGVQHELVADDDGVIRPTSDAEVEHLERLGLPVARKVAAEEKAAAKVTTKRSARKVGRTTTANTKPATPASTETPEPDAAPVTEEV